MVGYRPTGSSDVGKPPLGGTTPSTENPCKTGINKPIPRSGGNPTQKGETCHAVSILPVFSRRLYILGKVTLACVFT